MMPTAIARASVFAMRGVLAQHFVDALAVVISDGSVRDQVIAASR